jgi:hypothetical protein
MGYDPLSKRRKNVQEVSSHILPRDESAVKLTQATIHGLILSSGKSEAIYFDDDLPGFGLRLRAGG